MINKYTKTTNTRGFKSLKKTKLLSLSLFCFFISNFSYADKDRDVAINNEKDFFYTYDLNTLKNQQPTDINLVSKFFSVFPFEKSIKTNYGNGDNMVISFVDANCFDCLEKFDEMKKLGEEKSLNLTNYVFLVNKLKLDNNQLNINDFLWCIKNRESKIKEWFEFKLNYVNAIRDEIKQNKEKQKSNHNNYLLNKSYNLNNHFILQEWIKQQKDNKYFIEHLESDEFKKCYSPVDYNTRFYYTFLNDLELPSIIFTNGLQNNLLKLGKKEFDEIFKYITQFPQPSQIQSYEYLEEQKTLETIKFFK